MLTVLEPGTDVVPWLGNFRNLGPIDSPNKNNEVSSFPVRPAEKRSYSQNAPSWIRQVGLQSDIQKILRHARKLPEKTQNFYKVSTVQSNVLYLYDDDKIVLMRRIC